MTNELQQLIDRDDVFDITDIVELEDEIDRRTCGWPPATPAPSAADSEFGWDEIPF
jgi:hypothetical protein